MTRALLIMGPTASGKSALALALAERLGGEIVNADSMQVYADLRVLTARPSAVEAVRAPHHLYGHIDAAAPYSVARWLEEAVPCIAAIQARGRAPIVVGGTGLYFTALTRGLADAPEADPALRAALFARVQEVGAPALHAELAERDPVTAARISPNDARRIVRALEVAESGETLSTLHARTRPAIGAEDWRGFVIPAIAPRTALHAAIDARFDAMLHEGAVEEVRALVARGLDPDLPAMKALGVPHLLAHLRGEMSREAAVTAAKAATRAYAKRQNTWASGQMPDWVRLPDHDRAAFVLDAGLS
jgi:tRNA dimethylallyltransferase